MSIQNAAEKIIELFVVTPQEAQKYAEEFIELVEAHGGYASQQVIENQIPKVFGDRLAWRNGKKQIVENKRKATVASYNAFINKNRH